ncbi:unnamed protein product [Ilex paraguariensis]|uniref:Uncharacterized protein n=1 Tax=Ilex paraguariensis TaxID=185542 RepID=A0ABC8RY32_9AQUA
METEERNQRACKSPETDLFLQWGNSKRVRCVRFRDPDFSDPSKNGRLRRKISSRFLTLSQKQTSFPQPPTRLTRYHKSEENPIFFFSQFFPENLQKKRISDVGLFGCRNSETAALQSENRKSSASVSPEKERFYTTRGSVVGLEEIGQDPADGVVGGVGDEKRGVVWPKLYIALSSKEKEEDFMAMKGCKLPQRPKKRAKIIQRTLLVSPSDTFIHKTNPFSLSLSLSQRYISQITKEKMIF